MRIITGFKERIWLICAAIYIAAGVVMMLIGNSILGAMWIPLSVIWFALAEPQTMELKAWRKQRKYWKEQRKLWRNSQ